MKITLLLPVLFISVLSYGPVNRIYSDRNEILASDLAFQSIADITATNFPANATKAGLKEVEMGTLAQQKAKNSCVKNFAAMMVADHAKSNNEIKQMAAAKSIGIVSTVTTPDLPMKDYTSNGFDIEYMVMMIKIMAGQ